MKSALTRFIAVPLADDGRTGNSAVIDVPDLKSVALFRLTQQNVQVTLVDPATGAQKDYRRPAPEGWYYQGSDIGAAARSIGGGRVLVQFCLRTTTHQYGALYFRRQLMVIDFSGAVPIAGTPVDIFVTSDELNGWGYVGVYASDGDNEHFLMYGSAGVHALGGNRYVAVYCSTYSYSLSSYQNAPGALISRKFNIDGLAITMNTAPLHFHAVPQLAPTAGRYTNYSSSTMWIDDGQHLVLLTPTSYNAIGMGMAFVLSFNSAGSISRVVVSDLPRLDVGYAMPAVRGGKMRRYATWVSGGNVTDLFQGDLYRATKTTHSYGDSRYQIGPREWWYQNNHWPVAASHVAACLRIDDGLQLEIDSVDAGTTTAAEMVLVPGAQDMPNACPTGLEEILFTASGYVVGRQPDAVPLFTFLVIWSVTLDDLTAGTGVVKGYFA